ncbi:MAG: hypothetical protein BroJett040_08800 [Oligoflexia bacterium]|nr:MAG: hypothetical protein BroJett040_08800 [Oligoflexia bacterium]
MKKALLTAALATLTFATANAGSINLELRADMLSSDFNTDAGNADYYKFYLQTGRVDFKGSLMEGLDYRLRWRFNSAPSADMGSVSTNDFAYVSHKMNDMFKFTFGKQGTGIGGFEGNTAGSDLYFTSFFYGGSTANLGVAASSRYRGYASMIYATGVKADVTSGDHGLSLGAYNNDGSQSPQNKGMFGAFYSGAFMDKALKVTAGQLSVPSSNTTGTAGYTADDKSTYTNVGVGYTMGSMDILFDYNMHQQKFKSSGNDVTYDLTGPVLLVKYGMGNWTPQFKYAMAAETVKVQGSADQKNTFTDMGLAAEYKPETDKNFRYHFAYNNRAAKYDSTVATTSPAETQIIAGMKIYADFLK